MKRTNKKCSCECSDCPDKKMELKKKEQMKTNTSFARKKITILAGALLVMLLPVLCSASLGTFKQGDCVEIKTILNTTSVNISTISYPNTSVAISNQAMTKIGSTFNFTYCSTSQLGIYIYDYFDSDGNVYVNDFEVTPNGTSLSSAQGIIYFVFLVAGLGLFFLCLYYAVKIPWRHERDEENYVIGVNELKYLKLFLIVACYLIIMFLSGLLRSVTANYIPEIGVSLFFEWVFWIMLSFMYPIIVASLIFALIIWISNKKFTKALERGLPIS